ncbi:cupin domain-containing protein [Belnapia sp. T18]|uniref:Cupin domain-containing protein n=1 Tax=Belnapia arida TaxID=2804533 RepID=A0ABS1UBH2_9PROT|nr:cupin domain-containing protein [Belnapia arida]MBL6082040.1 cupin domain-containing protein [Belnapia arida]
MNGQRRSIVGATALLAVAPGMVVRSAGGLAAQEADHRIEGITWTVLQQVALAGVPGKDQIMGVAEIAPGAAAERHSHAEYEIGYVLQGGFVLEIDGEAPRTIRAGESYAIPAGKIHRAVNSGDGPIRTLAIYIVNQGRPLARPAG